MSIDGRRSATVLYSNRVLAPLILYQCALKAEHILLAARGSSGGRMAAPSSFCRDVVYMARASRRNAVTRRRSRRAWPVMPAVGKKSRCSSARIAWRHCLFNIIWPHGRHGLAHLAALGVNNRSEREIGSGAASKYVMNSMYRRGDSISALVARDERVASWRKPSAVFLALKSAYSITMARNGFAWPTWRERLQPCAVGVMCILSAARHVALLAWPRTRRRPISARK